MQTLRAKNETSIKKPWLTKRLINAGKKYNLLYKLVLKNRTDQAKFKYKQYKNKLNLFCLSVTGVNLWNKLDETMKQSKSLNIFKHQLRKLYIDSYAIPD